MEAGDLLVLFSDGIVEASNASEEEFGEERLCKAVRDTWSQSCSEILDEILRRVSVFLEAERPQDDMALVVARIR